MRKIFLKVQAKTKKVRKLTDRKGKTTMLSDGYIPFRTKMSALADTLKGHTLCSQIYPSHGASKSQSTDRIQQYNVVT